MQDRNHSRTQTIHRLEAVCRGLSQLFDGELRSCIAHAQELLNAVAYPVFVRAADGTWIGYNDAFAASMFGDADGKVPQPSELGLDLPVRMPPPSPVPEREVDVTTRELSLRTAGQQERRMLLSRIGIGGGDGHPAGELGVFQTAPDESPISLGNVDLDVKSPVLQAMQRRSARLEAVVQVSRVVSSVLSLDTLLPRSVERIRERFD